MKNKRMLSFFRILLALSFIISFLCIAKTYAKYQEDIGTNYEIGIKRWMIKVNEYYINNRETITEVMSPTFVANEYIKDGVIVPGSEGYFDINMDFSEVDVKFNFELDIGQADMLDFKIYGYKMANTEEGLETATLVEFTASDIVDGGIEIEDETGSSEGSDSGSGTESGDEGTESGDSGAEGEGAEGDSGEEEVTLPEGETDAKRIRKTIDPNTESIKKRFIRLYFQWYDGEGESSDNATDTTFTTKKNKITYKAIMRFDQYV